MSMTKYLLEYAQKHPDETIIIETTTENEHTHYKIHDVLSDAVICIRSGFMGEDDDLTLVPFASILRISGLVQ